MAKATTSKTESLTIRVPVDLMADLRAEAIGAGASVGSVVVGKARSARPEQVPDLGPVVYFVRAGEDGPVKIGWTKRLPSRIDELQPGSPVRLIVIRTVPRELWVERWFHDQFDDARLEGEWFRFDPRMLTMDPPAERPPLPKGPGLSTKTRVVTIRVPIDTADEWIANAKTSDIPLGAYVLARAIRGGGQSSRPAPASPNLGRSVDPDPTNAIPAKPLTDAAREYRRKLLTGAINPTKGKGRNA